MDLHELWFGKTAVLRGKEIVNMEAPNERLFWVSDFSIPSVAKLLANMTQASGCFLD